MKKRVLSVLLATTLFISILATPACAFHVSMTASNLNPVTGLLEVNTIYVENADGGYDPLPVFDENGNQLYIQVGPSEWEKLDTPLTPEEVKKQQEEAAKAEEAARANMKAEIEKTYHILISDDYASTTANLERLEDEIKMVPSVLWEKVTSQLGRMGRTLRIEDMRKTMPGGHVYNGFYSAPAVQISISPFTPTIVIPHEYGHMLFMTILPNLYGSAKIRQEWNALSGGEGPTHVSDYAATSYDEDLAETFSTLLTGWVEYYGNAKDLAHQYPDCLAIKKLNYVRDLVCEVFSLDKTVFPSYEPSYPSKWAKAEVEEYQNLLGGGKESVVPYRGNAHSTGYQVPATRLQFVYSISNDLIRSLHVSKYFGNISYDSYEKQWAPTPEKMDGKYQIPFTDVDQKKLSHSAICAIHSMNINGIVLGKTDTSFDPYGQITRQEAATILYRLCTALGYEFPETTNEFADADKIAPWAAEAVRAVNAAGIMSGVGDNKFDPRGIYTCEQSALCLLRTYKLLLDYKGLDY